MRIVWFIVEKEFRQIFRNRMMLPFIFLMPIFLLVVLVNAATLDLRRIDVALVDNDLSQTSLRLTGKFEASDIFYIPRAYTSLEDAFDRLQEGSVDMVLNIPAGFERKILREEGAQVQILIDAINALSAGLINYHSQAVVADMNRELLTGVTPESAGAGAPAIEVSHRQWYNPEMDYRIFMYPGILVILVTIVGMFLTAVNIVREKEAGTIEQLNVTPVRKYHFIMGKLIPFWIIGMFEIAFGLLFGALLYNVPVEGSLFLVFLSGAVFLFLVLGLGLFLSIISTRQQQVMFLTWFFMLVFILMSGIFTPVESMPGWAQQVNVINPFAYLIRVFRMIMLKGAELAEVQGDLISMAIFAFIVLTSATLLYRKTAAG